MQKTDFQLGDTVWFVSERDKEVQDLKLTRNNWTWIEHYAVGGEGYKTEAEAKVVLDE